MCSGKILWLVLNSSNSKVGPELCSESQKHSLFSHELALPLSIFILRRSVFLPAQSTVYIGSGVWDRWQRNYSLHFTKEERIFPSFQGAGQRHFCGCREEAMGFERGVVTLHCSSPHVAAHLCYLDRLFRNKAVVLSRRNRRVSFREAVHFSSLVTLLLAMPVLEFEPRTPLQNLCVVACLIAPYSGCYLTSTLCLWYTKGCIFPLSIISRLLMVLSQPKIWPS